MRLPPQQVGLARRFGPVSGDAIGLPLNIVLDVQTLAYTTASMLENIKNSEAAAPRPR